jgi:hypothetical protein
VSQLDVQEQPLLPPRHNWNNLLSALGSAALLAIGGHTLALLAHSTMTHAESRVASASPATGTPAASPLEAPALSELPAAPLAGKAPSRLVGPPAPAARPAPVGPPAPAGRRATPPGRIGPAGPVSGPLSTNLPLAEGFRGPIWTRNALPAITPGSVRLPRTPVVPGIPGNGSLPGMAAVPRESTGGPDLSSEIPDQRALELTRLANPQQQVRSAAGQAAPATAEKPVSVSLAVARPKGGYEVGQIVTVRAAASTEAYIALIRVDAAGKSSVVFSSARPVRSFARALRAGPVGGPEYLVAIASAHPLNGAAAAGALRSSGAGFSAVPASQEGTPPGQAWSLALAEAASLSGAQARWERFEWAVATASFGTRAPKIVASKPAGEKPAGKPAADKAAGDKADGAKPAAQDGSALPGAEAGKPQPKPAETKPDEKPAEGKPAEGKPGE